MTTLHELRYEYRKQHEYLMMPNEKRARSVTRSSRRQKSFRPRGKVYFRLLMLDINKELLHL
jgi:hypothetical protein